MEFDIVIGSNKLSEFELSFIMDDLKIDVLWYRAMINEGRWKIDRHKHSSFEFHFIASGQCKVVHDDGEFVVSAGEYYITAPGVYHAQYSCNENKFIEYCINCELKLEKNELSESWHMIETLKNSPCMSIKDTDNIIGIFEIVLFEAQTQSFGFYNTIKSLTAMIIGIAARNIANCNEKNYHVPLKRSRDTNRLEQIKRYIEDNIADNITTGGIASFMFLSERQICRIIKQLTGMSTKEYISNIKLQKAKYLLLHTNLSNKEISEILGFSSEYYFSQFFKNTDGYSPRSFRTETKNV